ncbi:MAG: TlyA family RNA methyltransferase [Actinomycetota bacterium]|nr:TlyA family RNA methyltransferase [Actinomycetota bacterium]
MALVRRGLASSRAQAKRLIITQQVVIVGGTLPRPSSVVASETVIEVVGTQRRWVSRGAEKLLGALDTFPVEMRGKRVLDVGASTGGFTEVALEAGASTVVAVDVGRGQLHERLSSDPRVISLEKTNIRNTSPEQLGGPFPFILVDLSFISLCVVAGSLAADALDGADLIVLVKPQFEVGRSGLGHGGIVRDPVSRAQAVAAVIDSLADARLGAMGLIRSPIDGGDGNIEYLLWLRKGEAGLDMEVPI